MPVDWYTRIPVFLKNWWASCASYRTFFMQNPGFNPNDFSRLMAGEFFKLPLFVSPPNWGQPMRPRGDIFLELMSHK